MTPHAAGAKPDQGMSSQAIACFSVHTAYYDKPYYSPHAFIIPIPSLWIRPTGESPLVLRTA